MVLRLTCNAHRSSSSSLGYEQDLADAAHLKLAADQGNADAQIALASMYEKGDGVTQDLVEAVRLYKLAVDQGDARAQWYLATMYYNGSKVRHLVEAARLFKLAADQGDANAQLFLGSMYEDGKGVKQDVVEAARLYALAAEQGDANAQLFLGSMYEDGKGVKQDVVEAARLYALAADQGEIYAQLQWYLGLMASNLLLTLIAGSCFVLTYLFWPHKTLPSDVPRRPQLQTSTLRSKLKERESAKRKEEQRRAEQRKRRGHVAKAAPDVADEEVSKRVSDEVKAAWGPERKHRAEKEAQKQREKELLCKTAQIREIESKPLKDATIIAERADKAATAALKVAHQKGALVNHCISAKTKREEEADAKRVRLRAKIEFD